MTTLQKSSGELLNHAGTPSAPSLRDTAALETGNGERALKRRPSRCLCCAAVFLGVVLALVVVGIVLYFTIFKPKDPTTTIVSTTVSGVSPRLTLPAVHLELNVTLDLVVRVDNPNRASFRHGAGETLLFYRGVRVGDAALSPGTVPARGSETMTCRLTIQADRMLSDVASFVGDVLSGEVGLDTTSRLAGRVVILGIFKRHAVALVECHVVVGFPDLRVRSQSCDRHLKL